MKIDKHRTLKLFFAVLMASMIAGCDQSAENVKSVFDEKETASSNGQQTYIIGVEANYPPLSFRDADGQLIGLEIDMFNAIAEEQKFNAVYLPMAWGDIMPSLDTGERDVGMSLWYSDERAQKYDMSEKVYSTKLVLARLKQRGGYDKVDDVHNAKISLQGPDTLNHRSWDLLNFGAPERNNKMLMTKTTYLAFKALISGQSDYVLDSDIQLNYFIANTSYTRDDFVFMYDDRFPSGTWTYAVKKGNTELLNKINQGIKNLKNNGTYKRIVDQWGAQ